MILMIIAIGGIAMFVLLAWISNKSKQQLLSEGKIIEREGSFHKKIQQFTTTAEFDQICNQLESAHAELAKEKIEHFIDSEKKFVLYKSVRDKWEAEFVFDECIDDKNQYSFCFTHWTTRNGLPINIASMNMLQTAIEKAILSLDSNTKVVSLDRKLKTKLQF